MEQRLALNLAICLMSKIEQTGAGAKSHNKPSMTVVL